jgi:hypothetical protein
MQVPKLAYFCILFEGYEIICKHKNSVEDLPVKVSNSSVRRAPTLFFGIGIPSNKARVGTTSTYKS